VEGADDTALDNAPKAFNRIGVDRADNILPLCMVDSGVWIASLAKPLIANPLIRAQQANFVRDGFVDERFQRRGTDVLDNAGYDVTFTTDGASNDGLARTVGPGMPSRLSA